jgi:hypothetical protein
MIWDTQQLLLRILILALWCRITSLRSMNSYFCDQLYLNSSNKIGHYSRPRYFSYLQSIILFGSYVSKIRQKSYLLGPLAPDGMDSVPRSKIDYRCTDCCRTHSFWVSSSLLKAAPNSHHMTSFRGYLLQHKKSCFR